MIYVYALSDPPPAASIDVRGLGEEPLLVREHEGVAAVYSATTAGAPRPTPENVWRHEQVAERLMAAGAVLPARFGTVLPGEDELDDLLRRNRPLIADGLGRVRGCVELGVRVLTPPADEGARCDAPAFTAGEETSGRAYLQARMLEERARRESEARAKDVAARLHDLLRSAASDATLRVLPTPRFLMTGAYLVPRERVDDFRRRVGDAGANNPGLRLLCTGPWPPYHFVPELSLPAAEVQRV